MWLRAAAFVAFAGLAACSTTTSSGGQGATRIVVTPLYVGLKPGGTQQLTAVVYDANNNVMTGAVVTYRSGDTTVAKVSASGNVTGVATGLTTILVSSPPASASIVVNISGVAVIQLSPDSSLITGTQTVQLTAVARDSLGNVVTSAPITFVSPDTTIVTVSSTGLVSRRGVGSVWVFATSGAAHDSVLVTALIARVNIGGVPFAAVVYSATRGYVTMEGDSGAQQLDLSTPGAVGGVVRVGQLPTSMALNSSGTLAYVGNQGSSSVTAFNTSTGAVTGTIALNGSILSVMVAPGDSLLLAGTDNGQVYVVRLSSSLVIDSIPVNYTNTMTMRNDTTLLANNVFNGTIAVVNLRTRQVLSTLTVNGRPQGMAVSTNGATLYLANEIGQLQFWDITSGTMTGSLNLPGGGGYGLARNPATGLLYISTSYIGSTVHVIDPSAKQIVREIAVGGTPRRIAFTADGSVGIVTNELGWIDYIK